MVKSVMIKSTIITLTKGMKRQTNGPIFCFQLAPPKIKKIGALFFRLEFFFFAKNSIEHAVRVLDLNLCFYQDKASEDKKKKEKKTSLIIVMNLPTHTQSLFFFSYCPLPPPKSTNYLI